MGIADVLGINRRNIDYIMKLNSRKHFALVDDKLATKKILSDNGIPSATVVAQCDSFFGIDEFLDILGRTSRFAVKPANGSGGNGIAVVKNSSNGFWTCADCSRWDREQQREYIGNILYGTFSLDASGDRAFAEDLIEIHPDLHYFSQEGLPDVRVVVVEGTPVLSMLRVPTNRSQGKANLHSGGFALDINLDTGITGTGWYNGGRITHHPETGVPLAGRHLPFWNEIITISQRLQEFFPLGYIGADFAFDATSGPLILELNARPGLEIQNVTGQGLRPLLNRKTL